MTNEALRITVSASPSLELALKWAKHRAEEEADAVTFNWEGFDIVIDPKSDLSKVRADLADNRRLASKGIKTPSIGPVFPTSRSEAEMYELASVLAEEKDKQTETEALMGLQFC